MLTLHYDPASTVCRPIVMFLLEHDLDVRLVHVDLSLGEHLSDAFAALNPNRLVPVLDHDGFVLTESATILRYLAQLAQSPLLPQGLQERARVDSAIDWFNTGFYREFAYGYVYPLILDHERAHDAQVNEIGRWHRARAERYLKVLDEHMIGARSWVAGDRMTIADLFGAALVTVGQMVDFDLSPYPNVERWLDGMAARPSWPEANAAFYGWRSAVWARSRAA